MIRPRPRSMAAQKLRLARAHPHAKAMPAWNLDLPEGPPLRKAISASPEGISDEGRLQA
jgi:hypothetical protein